MGLINSECLVLKIKCDTCGKEEEAVKSIALVNDDMRLIQKPEIIDFVLPDGWIVIEWWSKLKERDDDYYCKTENVKNSGFFCSRKCLLKQFKPKRKKKGE